MTTPDSLLRQLVDEVSGLNARENSSGLRRFLEAVGSKKDLGDAHSKVMSLSTRRTLVCGGLVKTVVVAARDAEGVAGIPAGTLILDRLVRLADQAFGFALGKPGPDGAWRFPPKEWKLYQKDIKATQRELLAKLPMEVDPREYVALVLWWVENHREDIPPSPAERRHVWFTIAEQLQRLSELLDPERQDAPVEAGIGYSKALMQASGVWR